MKKLSEGVSYNVVFAPEPEGGYTVTVPAIPGCITYGATFEEAQSNVREAILLCLEDMTQRGEKIESDRTPIVSSITLAPEEVYA